MTRQEKLKPELQKALDQLIVEVKLRSNSSRIDSFSSDDLKDVEIIQEILSDNFKTKLSKVEAGALWEILSESVFAQWLNVSKEQVYFKVEDLLKEIACGDACIRWYSI